MMAENLLFPLKITNYGVFPMVYDPINGCVRKTQVLTNDDAHYYIGDPLINPDSPNLLGTIKTQSYPWPQPVNDIRWTYHICSCGQRSAREQVQDEILVKLKAAVEAEDLEKARELLELASKLKEL
jgi:hypothetical protein